MIEISSKAIEELIANGESQTAEFKSKLPVDYIVTRTLAAFANTEGGILLVGVKDTGEIIGLSGDELENTIRRLNNISSSLLPYPTNIGQIEVLSKNLVYALVEKTPTQYGPIMSATGTLYGRHYINIFEEQPEEYLYPDINASLKKVKPKVQVVAFVAMSFRDEEEPALVDYYRAMSRAVKATKLPINLKRVDLVEGDYEISRKVMDEIEDADIVIADFTLNPQNVYFELGYARGKNRRVIQTARKGTILEFDIRNWHTLFYRNATELEEKLIPELKAAYLEAMEVNP